MQGPAGNPEQAVQLESGSEEKKVSNVHVFVHGLTRVDIVRYLASVFNCDKQLREYSESFGTKMKPHCACCIAGHTLEAINQHLWLKFFIYFLFFDGYE